MRVILVNGSPHKNGNTQKALEEFQKFIKDEGIDSEIFWIGTKIASGCMGCYNCGEKGECIFDDKVNEFAQTAKDADAFVFGTAVHCASMTGNLTSFMDRFFYSTALAGHTDYYVHKPAAAIVTARRGGTTTTFDQLNRYFALNQMPIITSRYWNMVHGDSGNPENIYEDEEGIQIIKILAKNMAYHLKCIEAGKEKGIMPPKPEDAIYTNFIR